MICVCVCVTVMIVLYYVFFCLLTVGFASVVTSIYLCLYYNVINAWSFWYLFHSFQVYYYYVSLIYIYTLHHIFMKFGILKEDSFEAWHVELCLSIIEQFTLEGAITEKWQCLCNAFAYCSKLVHVSAMKFRWHTPSLVKFGVLYWKAGLNTHVSLVALRCLTP